MKRTLLALLLISSAAALFAAQPRLVKYNVAAKSVTSIETSEAISVEYTQGTTTSVTVVTPEDLKDKLNIKVTNGKLTASFKNSVRRKQKNQSQVKVLVTAPVVIDFEASSAGSIKINGDLSLPGRNVDIEVSSAASFSAQSIKCSDLDIEVSSAASAKISACKVNQLEVEASSAASLSIAGVDAINIKGEASSAAKLTLAGKCMKAALSKSSAGRLNTSNLTIGR